MAIRFPNFESSITQYQILTRGRDMYTDDSVLRVDTVGRNSWELRVGSARYDDVTYRVRLRINERGSVTAKSCNCPYHGGPVCKHIVAGLFEIRAGNYYDAGRGEEESGEDDEDEEEESFYGDSESEEDDEESSEEEENLNESLEKRINERKIEKEKAQIESQKAQSSQITDSALLRRSQEDTDQVEKEFNCQICLGTMDLPVSMACNAHSMCYDCTLALFKHQKKDGNGFKQLSCPTCREGSGTLRIKKTSDIKVNLELKRIREAYETEKRFWSLEKKGLEEIVSQAKPKEKQASPKDKKSDEKALKVDLENMDMSELEEMTRKIFVQLRTKGADTDELLKSLKEDSKENRNLNPNKRKSYQIDQEYEEKTKKSTDKDRSREEKEERYPLRNLKKLKTSIK